MGRLAGKVILITGAGSGIGKACAEHYAAEGAQVIVASQSRSSEAVAKTIVDGGGDAVPYSCDISDEGSVVGMVDFATTIGTTHPDARAAADEARQIFTRLGATPMLRRLDRIGL